MALAVQCPLPLCYNKQLEAMAVKEAAQVVPSLWPHLSQILIHPNLMTLSLYLGSMLRQWQGRRQLSLIPADNLISVLRDSGSITFPIS